MPKKHVSSQPSAELPLELKCLRCGHQWFRRRGRLPEICPKCKRDDWNENITDPEAQSASERRAVTALVEVMRRGDLGVSRTIVRLIELEHERLPAQKAG